MTETLIPALTDISGDYTIDTSHSRLGFVARHAMVTKVRGSFDEWQGTAHIDTANPADFVGQAHDQRRQRRHRQSADRDGHLKSADFFDVENFPEWTFASTAVSRDGDEWTIAGDLTIKDVTHPVTIEFEEGGSAKDPFGNLRVGFEGETIVNRKDWGLTWNAALETGGILVSEKIKLEFDISAIRPDRERLIDKSFAADTRVDHNPPGVCHFPAPGPDHPAAGAGRLAAVHALMAAQELHDIGAVEIEEEDLIAEWQRPSYDLAGSSVAVLDGDRIVAYAELMGADRYDVAVHPDVARPRHRHLARRLGARPGPLTRRDRRRDAGAGGFGGRPAAGRAGLPRAVDQLGAPAARGPHHRGAAVAGGLRAPRRDRGRPRAGLAGHRGRVPRVVGAGPADSRGLRRRGVAAARLRAVAPPGRRRSRRRDRRQRVLHR